MISLLQPLQIGNAVRVIVTPAPGADSVRVLRRTTDAFTGADDPGALVVAEGDIHAAIDSTGLINGSTYWYRDYSRVGGAWVAGTSMDVIPSANYKDLSTEVVEFVRARLGAALLVEILRGALTHENGKIPVLIASPTFEDTKFPVVTIHVVDDGTDTPFIGDAEQSDWFDEGDDMWYGVDGGLNRVTLKIAGWALNADARSALRKALKRIILANKPVFEDYGILTPTFHQTDVDDFQSYTSPVYRSEGVFSCLARCAVSSAEVPIREVISTVSVPSSFSTKE